MIDLYTKIIEFVALAKKLELVVRAECNYDGNSIFRGRIEKVIPYKGTIKFEGVVYEYFFHGSGIDFKSDQKTLHYDHYAGKDGLGVYFTIQGIFEDYNYVPTKEVKKEFENLIQQNLIRQWMPEIPFSEVYYLV